LQKIVPPIISSFTDEDSRVRYYACEALYNIARVNLISMFTDLSTASFLLFFFLGLEMFFLRFHLLMGHAVGQAVRGDFIVFFNDIFDALCKLSADADPSVQSAADLLDRVVKVLT